MKHSTLILLLLVSVSVLSFSQEISENAEFEFPNENTEDYQACDPNNRPQTCTQESNPVCGYIHDCEGGACTNTFGNDCEACSQANVDGYVQGSCEETRINCPEARPEICPMLYIETCAVAANCEGPNCFEDVFNSCVACTQENVAYSLPGACPYNNRDTRTYCEWNNLPGDCTEESNPVCAHRGNCVGISCYFTAGNPCKACTNANVDYHTPGGCSENEENRTYCDANNHPQTCAEEFNAVCAHKTENCEGDDCYYTAGNACTACGDSIVDWHTEGRCQNENNEGGNDEGQTICNPDNRPRNCDQQAYNPVCAYRPGCESGVCMYTAANHCSACNDIYVNRHTPGQC